MRKIHNPFTGQAGYNCFGCSPANPVGLHMEFFEEGEWIISEWNPSNHYQGYKTVLHGGIQTTLMDELASWTVYVKAQTAGVTSNINITFRKPVYTNTGIITLKAKIENQSRKLVHIRTELYNPELQLCSEASIEYFIYPQPIAKERFFYPGTEKFFAP